VPHHVVILANARIQVEQVRKWMPAYASMTTILVFTCVVADPAMFAHAAEVALDRYPTKPIRVVVGFPPGGPVDLQILHNNKLPFDAIRDFSPVGLLTTAAYVLIAQPTLPANNIPELVTLAKTQPGKLAYGTAGNGSFAHLAGELLKTSARIELVHVPYKGGAGSLGAVLGGQIPLAFTGTPPTLAHVKSGKVKALAVTSARRAAVLPQTPAIAESGFPDFDVAAVYGFFAPARTPPHIVTRLNRELLAILDKPDVRERLSALGLEPIGSTPEAHAAHIKAEFARWTPIIKATGMKLD
jgi:tripartite-type tricarboxylate transporter receptor subunit TctC